jgi:hypothetical protein
VDGYGTGTGQLRTSRLSSAKPKTTTAGQRFASPVHLRPLRRHAQQTAAPRTESSNGDRSLRPERAVFAVPRARARLRRQTRTMGGPLLSPLLASRATPAEPARGHSRPRPVDPEHTHPRELKPVTHQAPPTSNGPTVTAPSRRGATLGAPVCPWGCLLPQQPREAVEHVRLTGHAVTVTFREVVTFVLDGPPPTLEDATSSTPADGKPATRNRSRRRRSTSEAVVTFEEPS